ncbi:MAG: MinD/ParA family protein [Pseudomonadota bacterium]
MSKKKSLSEKNSLTATRVISVTSGKGGVGKTNIVTNLAYLFSSLGKKVLIMDADMGLANIDVLLGLTPAYNLQHVFKGEKSMLEIMVEGPGGMKILPASQGVQELTELTNEQKLHLLSEFETLDDSFDVLLIDTGAGISSNVMYFNVAAQEKIVVVTPEPTSITDAYAIMKVMSKKYSVNSFKLIVNEAKDESEAMGLFQNLSSVAEHYLKISIDYIGYIVVDKHMPLAVRNQKLVTVLYPKAPASLCFIKLAKKMLASTPPALPGGNIVFFGNTLLGATPKKYE